MSKTDRAVDAAVAAAMLPGVVWASAWYVTFGVPVWAVAEARRLLRR